MGIETYSTVANDNNNAAPNGWPEGMAALDVNNSARQNMADTRTQWNDAEWFEFRDGTPDGTYTFVANNQFKIVSATSVDVTSHWHVGRRVQIVNAGTFFATITATSFNVDTTTVTIDITSLTNTTLVALSGIISAINSSLPVLEDTFTAEFADASTGGNTATLGSQNSDYTLTGNTVTLFIKLNNIDATSLTGGNDIFIRNLPFSANAGIGAGVGSVILHDFTFSGYMASRIAGGDGFVNLFQTATGAADMPLTVAGVDTTTSDLELSITYKI